MTAIRGGEQTHFFVCGLLRSTALVVANRAKTAARPVGVPAGAAFGIDRRNAASRGEGFVARAKHGGRFSISGIGDLGFLGLGRDGLGSPLRPPRLDRAGLLTLDFVLVTAGWTGDKHTRILAANTRMVNGYTRIP